MVSGGLSLQHSIAHLRRIRPQEMLDHHRGHVGYPRSLEEGSGREVHRERLPDLRDQPCGQERVAAQLEEVIVSTHRSSPSVSAQISVGLRSMGVHGAV